MAQAELNAAVWRSGRFVSAYDHRLLQPAEALILVRHRDAFSGRVLDVGCGAGRVLAYLVELGADAHGIDISPAMVQYCRLRFPGADVQVADLAALPPAVEGRFDAILLADNVLDVLDHGDRRRVLRELRSLLEPAGLLVFSSHNRAAHGVPPGRAEAAGDAWRRLRNELAEHPLPSLVAAVARIPRRWVNRRRLGPLQYEAADHAVVNDAAHDYSLLHYYISGPDQERQLQECGYRLIELLELDGSRVPAGTDGRGGSLYYVAAVA